MVTYPDGQPAVGIKKENETLIYKEPVEILYDQTALDWDFVAAGKGVYPRSARRCGKEEYHGSQYGQHAYDMAVNGGGKLANWVYSVQAALWEEAFDEYGLVRYTEATKFLNQNFFL